MQSLGKLLTLLNYQLNLYILKFTNNLNNKAFLMNQGKFYVDQIQSILNNCFVLFVGIRYTLKTFEFFSTGLFPKKDHSFFIKGTHDV